MTECELYGCLYNEDGRCGYDNATLKFPYARACHQEIVEASMEAELDALDGCNF